ncbi:MAG: hypothetical protein LBH02_00670 [Methanocalculaceae archaeon]|nr:hypothetical protein [Methanocalculaceae archaeon]
MTLVYLFSSVGRRVISIPEIRSVVLPKTFSNNSSNPLNVMMKRSYGCLLKTPAWNTMIVNDTFSVQKIERVKLLKNDVKEYMEFSKNEKIHSTIKHYISMCPDIGEERQTNVDHVNGETMYLGKKSNSPKLQPHIIMNLAHSKMRLR